MDPDFRRGDGEGRDAGRYLTLTAAQFPSFRRKSESVANLARATLNYASASGLVGDIFDMGQGVFSGWAGKGYAESIGLRGQGRGSIVGLVPALGAIDDAWKVANGNPHKLNSLVPFGTVPYIHPLVLGVESALD